MPDKHFYHWDSYWGMLYADEDERFPSRVFGFENVTDPDQPGKSYPIPAEGAVYGFVATGYVRVLDGIGTHHVPAGGFWCAPNGCTVELPDEPETRCIATQRLGFRGIRLYGGPIEQRGRLRYIDTCTDTLLIGPVMMGDPCLNHLNFPPGIDQTQHTHPSTRAIMVARGRGACVTPEGSYELFPGRLCVIPTDGIHSFNTLSGESMDVVPYHPDTDFGPTHEDHPMVNRTLVGGSKIDNTKGHHVGADTLGSGI